jgi:hypothetical protein
MEHGPRLSVARKSYVLAVSHDGRRALLGGLGGLGVGQMWVDVDASVVADPTFIGAPVRYEVVMDPMDDALLTGEMLASRSANEALRRVAAASGPEARFPTE